MQRTWNRLRAKAKSKNLAFDLTVDTLRDLYPADGLCPMTGLPMSPGAGIWAPSVDRVSPELGYVSGNVRWVSMWYNQTKSTLTDAKTRWLCERVAKI